jgi:AcrR family transcriptional regulator
MNDDLRSKILDAAIHLLEQQGVRAFGQVKVAREAGVQQGHLTYYFPKKSDLVLGVLERLRQRNVAELHAAMQQPLDGRGREELLFKMLRQLLSDRKRAQLFIGLVAEATEDPVLREHLAEGLRQQRKVFAMLLGRSEEDEDLHLAMAALRGMGIESLLEPPSPEAVDAVLQRFRTWLTRNG